MRSVNKMIILGNLASDPEVRQTPDGVRVATFVVATTRPISLVGAATKETDFHRIVACGKLAEICGDYLEKGKAVYIEGSVRNGTYDKDGERTYVTEIHADEVNMLTHKVAPRPRTLE